MLQNVGTIPGLALPLRGNPAAPAPGSTLAPKVEADALFAADTTGHDSQYPVAGVKADDDKPVKVEEGKAGSGNGAGPADAAPVLAGDASALGTTDISGNLLALLGQIAPAGQ